MTLWCRYVFMVSLLASVLLVRCGDEHRQNESTVMQVHGLVDRRLDSLQHWLNSEFIPLVRSSNDSILIRRSFFAGRKKYKQVEFAVEYFFQNASRNINGPPLPDIEPEEHIVIEPGGFQVIEEHLFPFDTARKDLLREAIKMKSIGVRVKTLWESNKFRDDQVFDALRLECFRVITLGISGFDTPLSLTAINEVPVSLRSVQEVLEIYNTAGDADQLIASITAAIQYAQQHIDFNEFDRLTFITRYINPVTRQLLQVQKKKNINVISNIYALNGDIETLFDSSAFNINYFTPDANSHVTPLKRSLGEKLFYDPLISGNSRISCASCHSPQKAFTDGLPVSRALAGKGFLKRNTPTLLNAGLQKAQFYDMRSVYLEDQVRDVIENKDEIHGDLSKAVEQIRKNTAYAGLFSSAFGHEVTERDVQVALACYVRSLVSFNSRFDRYMRGAVDQMSSVEKKGFNVFIGKAKCGICHFMPLFNGTVPPAFTFTESEVIGVPASKQGRQLDADPGRYAIFAIDNFKNAFKTPGIRNIFLTAPYMHNGVYTTLEEVVEFYNTGGGAGLGLSLNNQTLSFDSLMLSAQEKHALVAFMKTLTDTGTHKCIQLLNNHSILTPFWEFICG